MKRIVLGILFILCFVSVKSQMKVGISPKVIKKNTFFEVESQSGKRFVVSKDSAKVGIGIDSATHRLHVVDSVQDPIKVLGLKSGNTNDSILVITSEGIIRRVNTNSIKKEPWLEVSTNQEATSNTQNIYQMGRVGIGKTNPTNNLVVRGLNKQPSVMGADQSNAIFRVEGESNHSLDMGTLNDVPYGSYIQSFNKTGTSGLPLSLNPTGGSIGIGTVNPTNTLHVVSSSNPLRIGGLTVGATTDSVLNVTDSGVVRKISTSKLASSTEPWFKKTANLGSISNTDTIYIMGNVGIGTNNPLNNLTVKGINNNPSALGTVQTSAIFRVEGETNHSIDMGTYPNTPYGGYIQMHNKTSTTTLPLGLNPNGGFVGIGKIVPTNTLHIASSSNPLRLEGLQTGASSDSVLTVTDSGVVRRISAASFASNTEPWNNVASNTGATTNTQDIYQMGKIGIGTTAPTNKLEIKQGTNGNSGLRFTNLNSSNNALSATSVGQKYLSVDANGDVVLAKINDEVISVSGLAYGLVSPVPDSVFQLGVFENSYSATDSNVIYINQTDGTQWVYTAKNGGEYKSYVAPASTAWYLANGTVDAGSNKTGSIYRSGNVGLGETNPLSRLVVGNGTGYEEVNVKSGGTSNAALKLSSTGVGGKEYSVYSTGSDDGSGAGNFKIYDNSSNVSRMLINKNGNVAIGAINTVDTSAQLEVTSTSKGFLPPRMTKLQRDAISSPASGLIVYCTNCNNGGGCLQVNDGTPADPAWSCLGAATAPNVVANCDGFSSGNMFNGVALSGANYKVTVTNNSFTNVTLAFQSSDVVLSGVSGLTVGTPTGSPALTSGSITLVAGQAVVLTYPITGTPTSTGTLSGTFTKLALNCTKMKQVNNTAPTFNCNGAVVSPNSYELTNGSTYSGTITIPYTVISGGDAFPSQTITSNGLSFTRNSGTYTSPSGNITYTISGTYTGTSNSTFNITSDASAGSCTFVVFDAIRGALATGGCASCAAYDAAAVNDVVQVTANEFNALNSITGITNFGRKNADNNKSAGGSAYTSNMFKNNITTGAYPFAFSTLLDASGAGVKLIKQSSNTTGASSVSDYNTGTCKLVSGAAGLYYFVMKRPNVAMPANTNIAVKGFWNGWGTTSGGSGCDGCTTGTPSASSAAENSKTCTKTGGNVTGLSTGAVSSTMYLNYNIKWTNTKQW